MTGRGRARLVATATLALFAGVVVLARVRLSSAPLDGDVCAYAVIGHEMTVGGRPLYSDLWERKPPLLYLTFAAAERVAGYRPRAILLVAVAAACATLPAVYAAGGSGGPVAGLVAAGLWTLLCTDLGLNANQPDPEAFINACLTAAVAVLLGTTAASWRRAVVVGVLLAAATMYKHNAALAALAILAAHAAWTGRRGWAEAAVAGSVVTVAWAAFLGRAYAVGRFGATVDVLFRQNVAYSGGSFGHNLLVGLTPSRLAPPFLLAAVAGPVVLVAARAWAARPRRRAAREPARLGARWGLLAGWAVGTWATVALTGLVFPHYDQLWLPVACVGGGWAAAGLWRSAGGRAIVGVVLGAVAVRQGGQFLKSPAEWAHEQYDYSVAHQNAIAKWVAVTLRPGEGVWELGNDNAVYFLSGQSPPTGLLFVDPLLYGTDTAAAWSRLVSDLDRRPPQLVILSSDWQMFFPRPDTPVYPWVRAHYARWRTITYDVGPDRPTTYTLFVRRGGRLDHDR